MISHNFSLSDTEITALFPKLDHVAKKYLNIKFEFYFMLKISKKDYAAFENEIHDEIKKVFLKYVDEGKITLAGRSTPPRPRGRPPKKNKAVSLKGKIETAAKIQKKR
jgi:hypothetical protein